MRESQNSSGSYSPINKTVTSEDKFRSRFSSLVWYNKEMLKTPILVVGAGGIGSWTTVLLARAGYSNITIMDDDMVEEHNIGGQLFYTSHIGTSKVYAISSICSDLGSYCPRGLQIRYAGDSLLSYRFIIVAVDNMTARASVFERFKILSELYPSTSILIDGRLLAEQFQVYTAMYNTLDRYQETLFAESEAEDEICSAKQTSHFAAGIAFNIVRVLNNHVSLILEPDCGRTIPFSIEDDGLLMLSKITI